MEMLEGPRSEERYDNWGGEASFIRTDLLESVQKLVQLPINETIRPAQVEYDQHLRLSPADLIPLIAPYETYLRVAA